MDNLALSHFSSVLLLRTKNLDDPWTKKETLVFIPRKVETSRLESLCRNGSKTLSQHHHWIRSLRFSFQEKGFQTASAEWSSSCSQMKESSSRLKKQSDGCKQFLPSMQAGSILAYVQAPRRFSGVVASLAPSHPTSQPCFLSCGQQMVSVCVGSILNFIVGSLDPWPYRLLRYTVAQLVPQV